MEVDVGEHQPLPGQAIWERRGTSSTLPRAAGVGVSSGGSAPVSVTTAATARTRGVASFSENSWTV